MSRTQRLILAIYCLLLAYCCTWVPWRVTCGGPDSTAQYVVYSLLWAAPQYCGLVHSVTPAVPIIILRILALTAIFAAAFVLSGIRIKSRATQR